MTPIFLHGFWRSGSTYVWSRFRALDGETLCFYEPLHHGLAKLTEKRIGHFREDRAAVNNHPVMDRPFFYEFRDLIKRNGRGIEHFDKSFEWHKFIMLPEDKHPALARYVQSLIDHAAEQNKTPVLGFNRTNLRVGWLHEQFPDAYHLYIDRDPYDIWMSYKRQIEVRNNYTFYYAWLRVLEANAAHPLIRPLTDQLPLRHGLKKLLTKHKSYYLPKIKTLPPQDTYTMIFYLWSLGALHALSTDNVKILDTARAGDASYIDSLDSHIRDHTGLTIGFEELDNRATEEGHVPDKTACEEKVRSIIAPLLDSAFFDRDKITDNAGAFCEDKRKMLGL